jgi:hypothetical protein
LGWSPLFTGQITPAALPPMAREIQGRDHQEEIRKIYDFLDGE